MTKVTLQIESGYESLSIDLEEELSIGRTAQADVVLPDPGLSRLNTTIFRDEGEILIVDENSSNGTFLNGERVRGEPSILLDGDEIKLGMETRILVNIGAARLPRPDTRVSSADDAEEVAITPRAPSPPPAKTEQKPASRPGNETQMILFVALGSTLLIILGAVVAIFVLTDSGETTGGRGTGRGIRMDPNAVIPISVLDPFGGQKQEDIDELVQYFEVQDEIDADDLTDVTGTTSAGSEEENFNVTVAYFKERKAKAREKRNSPVGNDPPGQVIPRELRGGVIKQKAKLREMISEGYKQPMDYADLAQKRLSGELVELPMATEYWVLEVGSKATVGEFTSFNFGPDVKSPIVPPGSVDYNIIAQLAANFSGEKYDMSNGLHRKQMKRRMLRMFHPRAKPVLIKLAKAYHAKFNRPLRVTSLSRSMQYQILLNKTNANSFRGRKGSLPPHTSGCAFDLARKHMTAEEQNFIMSELARMENEGILDALREGNVNACFHVFIYDDGVLPKM